MKLRNWILTLGTVSALIMNSTAHAQHGVGNSGEAVEINGKYYLLDLIDYGFKLEDMEYKNIIRTEPPLPGEIIPDQYIDDHVMIVDENISAETSGLIGHILHKMSVFERTALVRVIHLFNWRFVDFPLVQLNDSNPSIQVKTTQLAIRYGNNIKINKAVWKKMNIFNQVATIFHEIIYASLTPIKRPDGTEYQDSSAAMEIVASIMDSKNWLLSSRFQEPLKSFKINGVPKIDFLINDHGGFIVDQRMFDGLEGQYFGIVHNARLEYKDLDPILPMQSPDVFRIKEVKSIEDSLVKSDANSTLSWDHEGYCKYAMKQHWPEIVINFGFTVSELGLKDYTDQHQEHKQFVSVIKKHEHFPYIHNLPNEEEPIITNGIIQLEGKSVNQCKNELDQIMIKIQKVLDDIYPKKN